mmetsp:Transcript_120087/g.299564  ORF Transcript_120087/g.299564 Transcript_120087/m.299564 type:complete len:233 (-) Transcript_120087:488-1186(-)
MSTCPSMLLTLCSAGSVATGISPKRARTSCSSRSCAPIHSVSSCISGLLSAGRTDTAEICVCTPRKASRTSLTASSLPSIASVSDARSLANSPSNSRRSLAWTCATSSLKASMAGSCRVSKRSASDVSLCACPSDLTFRLASEDATSSICRENRFSREATLRSAASTASSMLDPCSTMLPSVIGTSLTCRKLCSNCVCKLRNFAAHWVCCCSNCTTRPSTRLPCQALNSSSI